MPRARSPEAEAFYRVPPDTTFSITSGPSLDEQFEVRWRLGDIERLSMRLGPAAVAGLRRLPPSFTAAALDHAFGDRADARLALRHLLRRQLVRPGPGQGGDSHELHRHGPAAARGPSARTIREWGSAAPSLRITSRPLPPHDGTLAFPAAIAAVDDEWLGFGIAGTAADAETAARCEALERLGVLRPDLARAERETRGGVPLGGARGLLFECLRDFASEHALGSASPAHRSLRDLHTHRVRGSVPAAWLYIGASAAANTNGVAFGRTLADALLSGQRELVERDRLLRAWYGRLPSHRLTASAVGALGLAPWRDRARASGLTVRWFVLGTDRTPTVACVLHGDRAPHLGLGSATRASLADAAVKAFMEAAGSHLANVGIYLEHGPAHFTNTVAQAQGPPAAFHRRMFEAWWAERAPEAAAEIARRLSRSRIDRRAPLPVRGFTWVDLTPQPVERGRVVKVLHPDAVPLPNTMAQVHALETRLGVRGDGTPPPIA